MSLVKCPDCQNEVSSKAPSCPKCGAPISSENIATKSNLVTIQKTAKTLKMQSLIAVVMLLVGIVMLSAGSQGGEVSPVAPWLIFVGFIWLIVTRVRKWWHHS